MEGPQVHCAFEISMQYFLLLFKHRFSCLGTHTCFKQGSVKQEPPFKKQTDKPYHLWTATVMHCHSTVIFLIYATCTLSCNEDEGETREVMFTLVQEIQHSTIMSSLLENRISLLFFPPQPTEVPEVWILECRGPSKIEWRVKGTADFTLHQQWCKCHYANGRASYLYTLITDHTTECLWGVEEHVVEAVFLWRSATATELDFFFIINELSLPVKENN